MAKKFFSAVMMMVLLLLLVVQSGFTTTPMVGVTGRVKAVDLKNGTIDIYHDDPEAKKGYKLVTVSTDDKTRYYDATQAKGVVKEIKLKEKKHFRK